MTKEEAIKQLAAYGNRADWDAEDIHIAADQLLLNFLRANGHGEVADAFDRLRDDVRFWYA